MVVAPAPVVSAVLDALDVFALALAWTDTSPVVPPVVPPLLPDMPPEVLVVEAVVDGVELSLPP